MATRNRTSLKEALRSCYPDDVLRELAKKAEVQQRTRKVTVTALFWTLILGFGTGVQRSIAELRREFQQASGRSIVRSSFYDRFTPQWTAFLKAVVNWATSAYGEPTEKLQGRLAGFRDVVVTDSTVLRLHNLLAALLFAPLATLVVYQFVDFHLVRSVMAGFGFVPWQLPLVGAWFLLVHPLAEEAFWRGTIYEGLARDLPQAWAAGLSSVLFGAWHALVLVPFLPSWWWLGTLGVIGFGLAMVGLYRARDGQLLPCTLFHSLGGDLPLLVILALVFAS